MKKLFFKLKVQTNCKKIITDYDDFIIGYLDRIDFQAKFSKRTKFKNKKSKDLLVSNV